MASKNSILNTVLWITIFTMMSVGIVSCQKNNSHKTKINTTKEMEKYEWRPTACAPKYNPMQIHNGRLIYKNGESIYIPKGHTLHQGWGKIGPTHVVGDDLKPIPIKLEITWISYREKKFYKGTFDLPTEKINKLFKEGYINRFGKKDTYSRINVGLAPKGVLVLWMMGNGWSKEIARFQASETEITIQEFAPSAIISMEEYLNSVLEDDFNEETKAKMNPDSIPFGKWDNYRTRYNWRPVIKFTNEATLKETQITFYNGESLYTLGSNKILNQFIDYPIPDHIKLEWTDKNNNEFGAKIYFDENESNILFEKVYKNKNQTPTELVLEIDKYNSNLTISLQNELETISFKKVRIKVYETSN
ncbi:DUF2931 family protein [Aquimarina sp. 2201CG5-10]|uniref:DUF2931 family protein n=1 Tax=Aquimarina callyspongiae TaxID=3098150 RepID=UPI002AB47E17|nr:DUF2931 family protein [Aquimarina sp. 2201CG5-10]MDY8138334.1 DUF2931 family protein [Aquimarina sp. 2201CG5-10]